jgi:hypothetical protein
MQRLGPLPFLPIYSTPRTAPIATAAALATAAASALGFVAAAPNPNTTFGVATDNGSFIASHIASVFG